MRIVTSGASESDPANTCCRRQSVERRGFTFHVNRFGGVSSIGAGWSGSWFDAASLGEEVFIAISNQYGGPIEFAGWAWMR